MLLVASIKRIQDLPTFLVNESCLELGLAEPFPTAPFRSQVVKLQALPPEEAEPALALLYPICALRLYVDRTQSFRTSEQLFVCYRGRHKGNAISKQRMPTG